VKMKRVLLVLIGFLFGASVWAQAPQKMSYQAIIRNDSNLVVASSLVGIKISVVKDAPSGTAVFVEQHTKTTNANGLVSLEIGGGLVVSGSFSGINWGNGPYFIKIETDPTGGINYSIEGTTELLSVPYALFAAATSPSSAVGSVGPMGPIGPQGPAGATGLTGVAGWSYRYYWNTRFHWFGRSSRPNWIYRTYWSHWCYRCSGIYRYCRTYWSYWFARIDWTNRPARAPR
jgi:hypothetical protein